MQHVPSLRCGAGVRPAKGQGALGVQMARRGPGWEVDGVARCSEALLGHGTAVGPKQVQVGENSSALALGGSISTTKVEHGQSELRPICSTPRF